MRFDILTLFPEMFPGYLGQSLLNAAVDNRLVSIHLHQLRDWAGGKHRQIDDRPYGGGPGMILLPEPTVNSVNDVRAGRPPMNPIHPTAEWRRSGHRNEECESTEELPVGRLIMLTPQGRRLTQAVVTELANEQRLILLCGRYEGFDDRVRQVLQPDELSIGDYVLGGGEVAAMVVIDAVIRLIPGVLGHERSAVEDSFSGDGQPLLEGPQFTRPREFCGLSVPDVLMRGNHAEIAAWRKQQSLARTRERRADLLTPEQSD